MLQGKDSRRISIRKDSVRYSNKKRNNNLVASLAKYLSGSFKVCNFAEELGLLQARMSVTEVLAAKTWVAAEGRCSNRFNTKRKMIGYFANGVAESSMKLPETGIFPFVNKNSNNNRLKVEGSSLHRLSAKRQLALENEANSLKFNHKSNSSHAL